MIRFRTSKSKPNYSLEGTIDRIAEICVGQESAKNRFRNDNGTYVLGSGNDWFLRPDREVADIDTIETTRDEASDDNYRYWELEYRYTTAERQKALNGLAQFLEYTLGDI